MFKFGESLIFLKFVFWYTIKKFTLSKENLVKSCNIVYLFIYFLTCTLISFKGKVLIIALLEYSTFNHQQDIYVGTT